MSASDTPGDSGSGGLIATDEQSSSSSESRAPVIQQVSGFGPDFSGISATASVLRPKTAPVDSGDKLLPMDSTGDGVGRPPSADAQHEMMDISHSPPSAGISSMEVSRPSEGQRLEQPAIPEIAIKSPLEVAQLSPATQESYGKIGEGVLMVPHSEHSHYRSEKCDCLQIIDEGGVKNPHKPLTRSVEKITERHCYKIKIDLTEFSIGDITVSVVDNCKLSIYAKRDVNAQYGRECHEFQKIMKIPEDADASSVAVDFQMGGKFTVRLDKKTVEFSKKTK